MYLWRNDLPALPALPHRAHHAIVHHGAMLSSSNIMPRQAHHLTHLDGLRAIALAGVLLFHFEVAPFSGGFAGVDVFLSLSGYLITRNIDTQLRASHFSLSQFYTRRFFRLYPAATATALAVVLLSFLLFSDPLALEACQSALSSMLFSSNLYFHFNTDYFDTSAILKPLLHTWSLSLEEQFYLIWAPFLVLVHRISPKRSVHVAFLTVFGLTSFVTGLFLSKPVPSLVFFELPARIYQFAAGALLALTTDLTTAVLPPALLPPTMYRSYRDAMLSSFRLKPALLRHIIAELVSFGAFCGLILAYIITPREATSLQMLPTTMCTCALIALPRTIVGEQVLSLPLLRRIGHLSYSAYLVHWPLYVFGRYLLKAFGVQHLSPVLFTAATLVLAWLLKTLVEDAVRFGPPRRRVWFGAGVLVTLTLCALSIASNGFAFRTTGPSNTDILNANLARKGYPTRRDDSCKLTEAIVRRASGEVASRVCSVGDLQGQQSNITMLGNSFAAMYIQPLRLIGQRRNTWFNVVYGYGCRFHARVNRHWVLDKGDMHCLTLHDRMWDLIEGLPSNSTVVLSVANGFRHLDNMRKSLVPVYEAVKKLGHTLVILSEPPGLATSYESHYACVDLSSLPFGRFLEAGAKLWGRSGTCSTSVAQRYEPADHREWLSGAYETLFANELRGARLINLFKLLCKREMGADGVERSICRMPQDVVVKGGPTETGYKRDLLHLSTAGSYWMTNVIEVQLFGARS